MESNKHVVHLVLIVTIIFGFIVSKFFDINLVNHNFFLELEDTEPIVAWKLLTEFQSIAQLNPTIISYEILHEDENSFVVSYSEHLVSFRFVAHNAIAKYEFHKEHLQTSEVTYSIHSHHETKVLGFTLNTWDNLKFSRTGNEDKLGTVMETNVKYECPVLLLKFCEAEFTNQRALIHSNLKQALQEMKLGQMSYQFEK